MLTWSKDKILSLFTWLRLYSLPEIFTASLLRVVDSLVFRHPHDLVSLCFPNLTSHCFSNLALHSNPTKLPNSSPATVPFCTQMALTGIPWAPQHRSISHPSLKTHHKSPLALILQDNLKKNYSFASSFSVLWIYVITYPLLFLSFIDAKAVLWPPHAKSWLIGKDSAAGRDWGQEEKGTTEDELAGWHHQLKGHEFEWTLGVGDGQGGLACCDSWGRKESDTTEWLNWTELIFYFALYFHVT